MASAGKGVTRCIGDAVVSGTGSGGGGCCCSIVEAAGRPCSEVGQRRAPASVVDLASEQSLRLALGTVESGPCSWPHFFFSLPSVLFFFQFRALSAAFLREAAVAREEIREGLVRLHRGSSSSDCVGLRLTLGLNGSTLHLLRGALCVCTLLPDILMTLSPFA